MSEAVTTRKPGSWQDTLNLAHLPGPVIEERQHCLRCGVLLNDMRGEEEPMALLLGMVSHAHEAQGYRSLTSGVAMPEGVPLCEFRRDIPHKVLTVTPRLVCNLRLLRDKCREFAEWCRTAGPGTRSQAQADDVLCHVEFLLTLAGHREEEER